MLRARVAAIQHQTVEIPEAEFRAALNEGLARDEDCALCELAREG
jgi:hypothetical protein